MSRFHISDDGEPRPCHAASPATCRAKGLNGEKSEHFDSKEAAQQRSEEVKEKMYGKFSTLEKTVPETIFVEDSGGDVEEFQMGVLTDSAKSIFRQGQCLALATELCKKFETNTLLAITEMQDAEEYLWDDENNDFVYDEDGNPIGKEEQVIYHFYAVDKNNVVWDVDGKSKSVEFVSKHYEDQGYIAETGTVDNLTNSYYGYMSEQNYDFAESVVDKILEQGE